DLDEMRYRRDGGRLQNGMLAQSKAAGAPLASPASESVADTAALKEGVPNEQEFDRKVPMKKALARAEEKQEERAVGGKANGAEEPEQVRNDFRSTVIWMPSVRTDAHGKAKITVKFPDSLTTWRLTARADTPQTAIGTVTHEVKSNKDLMIRLQAPRFFTERDM